VNAIELAGVSKTYRRIGRRSRFLTLKSAIVAGALGRALTPDEAFPALAGIDLAVRRGESLGVIGGNGSGKSTLLKIVAGIVKPTSGRVTVRGRVAALLELGAGFHPEISGRENVLINGVMLGLTRRQVEERFDSIVRFAGLESFIDEPVKNYSSGMYVRLGFSIAVATEPEILLVDEVLAVGDEEFSHRCLARIRELQRGGTTILFVTHSLGLVVDLCDRAAWLDAGRIVAEGEPREVVDRYRLEVARSEGRTTEAARSDLPTEIESSSRPVPAMTRPESAATEPRRTPDNSSASPEDPRSPKRWGNGFATIRTVRFENARGETTASLAAGEPASILIEVEPHAPLDDFVFGIAVWDRNGSWVLGTNTDLEGMEPHRFDRPATIRIRFDSLDLVGGEYELDVAVHSKDGTPYDYIRVATRFHVAALPREVGLWRAKRGWTFEGGATFRGKRAGEKDR
jgi:ABC-type polysaccharide/polyol phosphate transport system ATPase subunit